MLLEEFQHKLPNGENMKFSIWKKEINTEIYYYGMVTTVDVPFYDSLPKHIQEVYYGENITDENLHIIYYSDALRLKTDLIVYYGIKWLRSEI